MFSGSVTGKNMSKIADYIEQQEQERLKKQEEYDKQTVADFAKELRKEPAVFMEQLRKAGVQKASETDRITDADKKALLKFLKKSHGVKRAKKITIPRIEDLYLKAVAEQANGAEWECLQEFMKDVIAGEKIDPKRQATVNLIVAKAIFLGALPMKKLGRPKSSEAEDLGLDLAQEYWVLRDSGTSYSDAVRHLSEKVHKDERHVMRLVKKHKRTIGLTLEDRQRNREWTELMANIYSRQKSYLGQANDIYSSLYGEYKSQPEFTAEDYLEFLDEQIVRTAQSKNSTDIK